MPTIFRVRGYRFYFVSHHLPEPPHVHVERGGATAKFRLERCLLAHNDGFALHGRGDVIRSLHALWGKLLEAWHDFFGTAQDG